MKKHDFHDYEISWDYELDENVSKENDKLIRNICKDIKKDLLPKLKMFKDFEVTPVILNGDSIAVYCFGTEQLPIIGIDIQNHLDALIDEYDNFGTAIRMSILHELGHAMQQYQDKEFDEEEAEDFARDYSDFRIVNKI